ncbi:MAG: hypothetical protein WCJ56_07680 [bacterium]
MRRIYDWHFPLPRTHTGMLLGNGTFGAMVWGEGSVLRITIGRADLWDHRGGMQWRDDITYKNIGALLEQHDESALRKLFANIPGIPTDPNRPSVLPIGRIELDYGSDATLVRGVLNMETGQSTVYLDTPRGECTVDIVLDMEAPVLAITSTGTSMPVIRQVSSWDYVGEYLETIGFPPPVPFAEDGIAGWVQQLPADPPFCVGYSRVGSEILLTAVVGDDARKAAQDTLAASGGFTAIQQRCITWWGDYWAGVPQLEMPNENLRFLYDYGMYKFAGLTNPAGVAATLQGPWIEEYQMPPWSSDYHFNINVQMCYWPAYQGNKLAHLRPLFDMIGSWMPVLRENARLFIGIEDGLLLPHAVDDHCTGMGGFWTGAIDHGCTAWVAQMMYRYYRYSMDVEFLHSTAYPFMVGAMRVYEEMLERDGDTLALPISVSPEFGGASIGAYGRNASFQLACLHRLAEDLQQAAVTLGEQPRPIWADILTIAPKASLAGAADKQIIALWEGKPLPESHRHHSHLAGIVPFDTLDTTDSTWGQIVKMSLDNWVYHGNGMWTGWCVPWAAMLHMRMNNGAIAELLLENWQRVFTNEGHGTLHDAAISGYTLFGPKYARKVQPSQPNKEIMQMDAGMACVAAILEMFLHTRRGIHHVFAGVPTRWRDASFKEMRTDGAFMVSGVKAGGILQQITVRSEAGGTFKLANPWEGEVAQITRDADIVEQAVGPIIDIATAIGETVLITRL